VPEDESYVQLPASREEGDAEAEAKVGDDLDAERSLVRVAERNVLSNSMNLRMNRTNKGLSLTLYVSLWTRRAAEVLNRAAARWLKMGARARRDMVMVVEADEEACGRRLPPTGTPVLARLELHFRPHATA
jgi:diphthamide synthase (EF-2-diphthine--ammonia ligase)